MNFVKEIEYGHKGCCTEIPVKHDDDLYKSVEVKQVELGYIFKIKRKSKIKDWGINHKRYSMTLRPQSTEEIFKELSDNWKNQTKAFSQAASKINNRNYLAIIGLGVTYPEKITNLILKDLQKESSYWHYALKKITQVSPPKETATNLDRARDFWLQWGYENNKL